MTIGEQLARELAREAAATRRVLERVPETKLSWKPHPKSMSLGQLALHIAQLPMGIADLVREPVREAPNFTQGEATTVGQVLSTLEESLQRATSALSGWSDEWLNATWRLTSNGQTLFEEPRIETLRTLMLNHWYHHRGQLTVYLRLLGVPLPPVYGPTADESPFG